MCQAYGNGPTAQTSIAAIQMAQYTKVNLNLVKIFGISSKKEDSLTSFAVALQDMGTLNMCDSSALETWMEMPPKKMVIIGTHLKFSITSQRN